MLGSGLSPAPYVVQGLLPHQGGGDSWLVYLKRPPSLLVGEGRVRGILKD